MRNAAHDIREFNRGRIPFLLDMKYKRMNEDAFRFFRGTSHLYYSDIQKKLPVKDATRIWMCADLHLENFGSFKGDNRQVYFDMNDFDDAALGSCSVEIARTITSIHLAAEKLNYKTGDIEKCAAIFIDRYITVLKGEHSLMVDAATATGVVGELLRGLQNRKRKNFLASRTVKTRRGLTLRKDHIKMWEMESKEHDEVIAHFKKNSVSIGNKKIVITDAAHRIAGTGSLGIHRYVLLAHQDENPRKNYLLELKESRPSAVVKAKRFPQPQWKNDAHRITTIQKRMQCVSPALLSPVIFRKKAFVLKELQPTDDRVELESCRGNVKRFMDLLDTLAEVTASAHLRATGRQGSSTADELVAFANNASWRNKLLTFSAGYAKQVKKDHVAFRKQLKAGFFRD